MNSEKQKSNYKYISLAGVLSCIAVVFLHSNGCFWSLNPGESQWFSANIIESVFYFAVPVFFMIPGVTLLDFNDRYSLKEYLLKRIRKTVIPYVFWSLAGLVFQVYLTKTISTEEVNPRYVVDGLLNGNLVSVYWFFIPLFSVYLSIPLLAAVPKEKRKELFTYLFYAGMLINILCPFIIKAFDFNLKFSLQVSAVSGHLIYVLAGWLINEIILPKKSRILIYTLSIAGFFVHLIGTYYVSVEAGEVLRTFKGYLTFPCVLYSIGVFFLLRTAGNDIMDNKLISSLVNIVKKYTFAIYLLHVFVLRTITEILKVDNTSLAFRLIVPWLIICICMVITAIIRRVPLLKEMLPE